MTRPVRILLQTTIPAVEDDWNINRFSLLAEYLGSLANDRGETLSEITTRDRKVDSDGNDTVLTSLDETDFDELWLFAVDPGDGLTQADCQGITRFRRRVALRHMFGMLRCGSGQIKRGQPILGWKYPRFALQ